MLSTAVWSTCCTPCTPFAVTLLLDRQWKGLLLLFIMLELALLQLLVLL
jgi:hypothetical protein